MCLATTNSIYRIQGYRDGSYNNVGKGLKLDPPPLNRIDHSILPTHIVPYLWLIAKDLNYINDYDADDDKRTDNDKNDCN